MSGRKAQRPVDDRALEADVFAKPLLVGKGDSAGDRADDDADCECEDRDFEQHGHSFRCEK